MKIVLRGPIRMTTSRWETVELSICGLNIDPKRSESPMKWILCMDVIAPISPSAVNTIWLGGGWPRAPRARLPIQSKRRSQPVAHLGRCVIRFPPLQLLSHKPLHLFPVDFIVTTQPFVLNTSKDTSWERSFQTALQSKCYTNTGNSHTTQVFPEAVEKHSRCSKWFSPWCCNTLVVTFTYESTICIRVSNI